MQAHLCGWPALLLAAGFAPASGARDPGAALPEEPRAEPEIAVYGNLLYQRDDSAPFDEDGNSLADRARVRQVDLDVRSRLGSRVEAVVIASLFSNEANTEYEAELDQGYVDFELLQREGDDALGLHGRVGRFRGAFGWMNPLRVFELPQPTRPRSLTQLFGEKGLRATGFSFDASLAAGGNHELAANLQFIYPADRLPEEKDVLRLAWRWTGDGGHHAQLGASHFKGTTEDVGGVESQKVLGFDFLYASPTSEPGRPGSLLLGGEWTDAEVTALDGSTGEPSGAYAWGLVRLAPRWYVGARYDRSEELDGGGATTDTYAGYVHLLASQTWRAALAAEYVESEVPDLDDVTRAFLELSFAMGESRLRTFGMRR